MIAPVTTDSTTCLAIDAASYLTGTTLFVHGGQTAMAPLP
jgi:hypothetical protein